MFGRRTAARTTISDQLLQAGKGIYNEHELAMIQQLGTTVGIEAGDTFVTEGALGREVLLILDGTAVVSRHGEEIAEVGAGDFVGEQAVLASQPRNASLIATTPMVATVFTPQEFRGLLYACPRLAIRMQELMAERAVTP